MHRRQLPCKEGGDGNFGMGRMCVRIRKARTPSAKLGQERVRVSGIPIIVEPVCSKGINEKDNDVRSSSIIPFALAAAQTRKEQAKNAEIDEQFPRTSVGSLHGQNSRVFRQISQPRSFLRLPLLSPDFELLTPVRYRRYTESELRGISSFKGHETALC